MDQPSLISIFSYSILSFSLTIYHHTGEFLGEIYRFRQSKEGIVSRKKNLLDQILTSPSFQNEFLRVDRERRYQISDVDLSDHRAMVVQLNLLTN